MQRFANGVVAEICAYMNSEQSASCLAIVKGPGAESAAIVARLVDFDERHATFLAETPSGERRVEIEWPYPVTERFQIRDALFALLDAASRML